MAADFIRPLLSSSTPSDDSGNVATSASIELSFTEAMKAGSGKIFVTDGATQTYLGRDGLLHTRIVNATDTRAIDITDTNQVTIAGNKVIIKPAGALLAATGYSVVMESGVLQDLAGNGYAGLADGNRLNFTTAADAPMDTVKLTFSLWNDSGLDAGDFITNTGSDQGLDIFCALLLDEGDRVQVSVDGETFIDAEPGEGFNHWYAGGLQLPGDAGTIVVRVVDALGAVRTAASQQYVIDGTAPALADTDPDEGGTVDGTLPSITLAFDGNVALDAATTLILLSDSGDVQAFGGESAQLDWNAETNVLTLALQHALHAGTQYRLVTSGAIADAAGNVGWAAEAVLLRFDTVDDGGEVIVVPVTPELSLHEDTASASDPEVGAHDGITNNLRIDVAGLQPGGSWEYSVDAGESWHTGSGDHFMLDAVSMTYEAGRIRVRQYGSGDDGQASESGTLGEVTIDVDAPRAVIDYGSFHFIAGGTSTVTGMLVGEADEGDVVEFTVDQGATWQRAGLDGYVYLHDAQVGYGGTIGLRVTDEAGNPGEAFLGASTVYVADGYGGTFEVEDAGALYAQGGDDRIAIGGTGFGYIDGGDGIDTLDVAFPEFDLADVAGNLDRMEVIDLGQAGGTARTLHVNVDAVRAIADGSTLTIEGDAFDTVTFDDGGWTWEHDDGTYVTWTNGETVLLIGSAIDVRGGLEV